MSTRIGVDNLVYAIMSAEGSDSVKPTYSTVTKATGVISLNITPNTNSETLFADNGALETAATLGEITVEINKASLTTQEKADLLGHALDTNGGLVYGATDSAPYVAIGFRALKANGKYRYTWLYKGKFQEPEDSNETKGDSINFQTDTISGNFVKLDYVAKIKTSTEDTTGTPAQIWKYTIDEDDEDVSTSTISAFFTNVSYPAEVTA